MTSHDEVASIQAYRDLVGKLLDFAAKMKPNQAIEPPLAVAELGEAIRTIYDDGSLPVKENKQAHYAAIETAFRDKFYDLIVSDVVL
jgi:THO complex subunit 1